LYLYFGESIIFKVALSMFTLGEANILHKDFEETIFFLRSCSTSVNSEKMLSLILFDNSINTKNLYDVYTNILKKGG
jgi:hypothetical protein